MYLFMCMIIKHGILGIQDQRNMSLAMPFRQGSRESMLNALYIFEFSILCFLQLYWFKYIPPYSTHNRPVVEHLLFSNPEGLSPIVEPECTLCLQGNPIQFHLCLYFSEGMA